MKKRSEPYVHGTLAVPSQAMTDRMIVDALVVLSRIDRGLPIDRRSAQRWVSAFRTVQWIRESENGLSLTAAGHDALASGDDTLRLAVRAAKALSG